MKLTNSTHKLNSMQHRNISKYKQCTCTPIALGWSKNLAIMGMALCTQQWLSGGPHTNSKELWCGEHKVSSTSKPQPEQIKLHP